MNFRLGRYFSISSLVGVVVVIAVLSLFYRYTAVNILVEHETRANTAIAKVFANIVWSKYSRFIQESSSLSKQELLLRPEIDWLQRDVLPLVSGSNIANIKIFNLNGMTIFSTHREDLGENASASSGFLRATVGDTISELAYNKHTYDVAGQDKVDRDLFSTYLPLRSNRDDLIHGVFELYTDVTELVTQMRRTQENVIGGVFLTLTLLYLFLQMIVRRADRAIQSHEKARNSSIEQIHYLAYHDPMTKLPNKQQFSRCIKSAVDNAQQNRQLLALMFIDVDRFKLVNDSLGHDAGDELLRIVAKRLQCPIRKGDQLFRWGGDEFTMVLENVSDVSIVENMASRIIDSMAEPIKLKAQEVIVTTSIGIALYSCESDLTSAQLINNADSAMYQAKRAGRNCFVFYNSYMNDKAFERLTIETSLKQALRNNEFRLYYQPRLSVFSGKVTAVEALLRWMHPQYGLMTPDKFIHLLEDSGMIKTVGEWVLNSACKQLKKWQLAGMPSVRVSVNISAKQLSYCNIVEQVKQAVSESKIDPHCLELEFTESVFVDDKERVLKIMKRLKETGVSLSIDDFGSGYWSLSYLKQIPVDYIKIGRGFVQGVLHNSKDAAITRAIARLAYSLNMRLVAEGVESQEQADALKRTGCHELQGFLFGKPMMPFEIPLTVAMRSNREACKLAVSQKVVT
ncbi:putative bifunctional diguanylate cyclase/phosphodiesterase [Kaarinaea lacus]